MTRRPETPPFWLSVIAWCVYSIPVLILLYLGTRYP